MFAQNEFKEFEEFATNFLLAVNRFYPDLRRHGSGGKETRAAAMSVNYLHD